LTTNPFDDAALFRVSAIFAPQNRARVERAVRDELQRTVREGFSQAEVQAAGRAYLEARRLQRAQDRALVTRLAGYSFARRTFAWDLALEAKLASLTAAEVNAALRKHIDPSRLAFVVAGDFKRAAPGPSLSGASAGRGSPPAAAPGAAAAPASPPPSAGSD